jgi:hypothetical protein
MNEELKQEIEDIREDYKDGYFWETHPKGKIRTF